MVRDFKMGKFSAKRKADLVAQRNSTIVFFSIVGLFFTAIIYTGVRTLPYVIHFLSAAEDEYD